MKKLKKLKQKQELLDEEMMSLYNGIKDGTISSYRANPMSHLIKQMVMDNKIKIRLREIKLGLSLPTKREIANQPTLSKYVLNHMKESEMSKSQMAVMAKRFGIRRSDWDNEWKEMLEEK